MVEFERYCYQTVTLHMISRKNFEMTYNNVLQRAHNILCAFFHPINILTCARYLYSILEITQLSFLERFQISVFVYLILNKFDFPFR